MLSLFDLDLVAQERDVVFLGRTGLGKTHRATALALAACHKGYRVPFATAVNVVNQLQAAQATDGSSGGVGPACPQTSSSSTRLATGASTARERTSSSS